MVGEQILRLYLPYPSGGDRLVRVFLPEHAEDEKLPVIYMTDGQNLFDKESSGFGCLYTREAVREERTRSGNAAILVGIHNDDPFRINDLSPASIGSICREQREKHNIDPKGEVFDDFLVGTVMPEVERICPVKKGRENTAFLGSSCGGMFSFFTALSHPDLFGMAGVFSPVFQFYAKADLDRWVRGKLTQDLPMLYIYSGAGEPMERDICASVAWTVEILLDCYPRDRFRLDIRPDQIHHEVAWEPVFRSFLHSFLNP